MPFDVDAAQKAGYSEDEILQHLTQTRKFDVDGAVKAGYSKTEIISHLSGSPAPVPAPTASIGPQETGVGHYLQGVKSDIETGGTTTMPGRILHALGAKGINSGTSPETAAQIAGPLVGPVNAAIGISRMGQHPVSGALEAVGGALQAASPALAFVAPEASEATAAKLGNTVRGLKPGLMKQEAGKLFQAIGADANKVPVNLEASHDAALKLMDWQRKTQLGPTLNKFLNRITSGKQGQLTYEEGRDFYSLLSQMSADEASKMSPAVKFQVKKLVMGLKQDIGQSADQVGRAADYYKAMGDYAHAAKLQEWYDEAKKIGVNMLKYAIPAGAAGYLAKKGIDVAIEK